MQHIDGTVSYLLPQTVITSFEASAKLLVVGCATCNNNEGELRIYNPATMKTIKGYVGSSNYAFMGKQVSITQQTDGAEMIWYSTRKSSAMSLNAIFVFENFDTEKFEFHQ